MADNTIVLITGANTGIGYETVKALYASSNGPYTIFLGGRSLGKAISAATALEAAFPDSRSTFSPLQIDITSDESIAAALETVKSNHDRIDVLINNAGAAFDYLLTPDWSPASIRASFNTAYDVNVTSTQVMTASAMPLLLKSADPRLLFVTSGLSSLARAASGVTTATATAPTPAGWPKPPVPSVVGYRSSKTALNMMMLDWVRLLEADGVKVWAISPGFLATGLIGNMKKAGAGDPSLGGTFIKDVVEGLRDADVGKVINRGGLQDW